jgi:two-component system KDP operon response regulator KdpE
MNAPRVLLVEDEPVTRLMVEARLRAANYHVRSARSAEAALELLALDGCDLLLTDLALDGMDGVTLMARARALDPELPIIVLTGSATLDSAIAAVHHGAHSYLRKPVAAGELEQRVAAALERHTRERERAAKLRQVTAVLLQIAEPQSPAYTTAPRRPALRVGALVIDAEQRLVSVEGQAVELTRAEYDLLLYLAERVDTVHSPERLAREVLGHRCGADESREMVKSHICRLRKKIELGAAPRRLLTVRGAGYMLTASE